MMRKWIPDKRRQARYAMRFISKWRVWRKRGFEYASFNALKDGLKILTYSDTVAELRRQDD